MRCLVEKKKKVNGFPKKVPRKSSWSENSAVAGRRDPSILSVPPQSPRKEHWERKIFGERAGSLRKKFYALLEPGDAGGVFFFGFLLRHASPL